MSYAKILRWNFDAWNNFHFFISQMVMNLLGKDTKIQFRKLAGAQPPPCCSGARYFSFAHHWSYRSLRGSGYLGYVDSNQGYNPYKWFICPLTRLINLHITSYIQYPEPLSRKCPKITETPRLEIPAPRAKDHPRWRCLLQIGTRMDGWTEL